MSDALEPRSGCSSYNTVFSYTLFSWSLNRGQVVKRAFSAPVSTGVSRDLQSDRSFSSALSCYSQTFSAPSAFGHIDVRAGAHKSCLLEGSSVWYLPCAARAGKMIRAGSFPS